VRVLQQKKIRIPVLAAGVLAALLISVSLSMGTQTFDYSGGRLSLSAENEPLVPILERIAKTANVVIFIAKGFDPGSISVHVENLPLETALKQVLKGYNVAMIYHKETTGNIRLSALKIYPTGQASGPMDVIIQETKPVALLADAVRKPYDSERTDILAANDYVHSVRYDTLIPTAVEFQQKEENAWEDIQELQERINAEVDSTKNDVLTLALLDKYEAFDSLQRFHINTLEKLDRIESFNQSKAKQNNE